MAVILPKFRLQILWHRQQLNLIFFVFCWATLSLFWVCMVQKLVRDVDRDCLKSPPPGRPLWDSHFLQWPWVAVFPFEFCQRLVGPSVPQFALHSQFTQPQQKAMEWGSSCSSFSCHLCTCCLYQRNLFLLHCQGL